MSNILKNNKFLPAVKKAASFLSWKCRFKNRYFFTKQNSLRLRYIAVFAFFISTGFATSAFVSFNKDNIANYTAQLASIETFAGLQTEDLVSGDLVKTINKNFDLASVAQFKLPKLNREIEIKSGDALGVVLQNEGISGEETTNLIKAMKEHYDPRKLKAGQVFKIKFKENGTEQGAFKQLTMKLDPIKTLVLAKSGDGIKSELIEKEVTKVVRARKAEVENSLYGSAAKADIPDNIVANAIKIYSWNTDFQRDIRTKDKLEVMYESYETEDGHVVKNGDILYANLEVGGRETKLYRYEMKDGRVDYFMPDGISVKRTLMKTPVDGARMSSGFGMRRHPVLGYNKMHKGVDFAARTGTPIYAAGDGVIEKAGWHGGYGKYVRIRHNSSLKTAYAHMSKLKVKSGTRVKQGDVIGTVGTTGRSTGPHLHYEVLKNGKQVNPRSVNLPTGEELTGKQKQEFINVMNSFNKKFASLISSMKLAGNVEKSDSIF